VTQLPSGWVEAQVADVADVISGQAPPGKSYNESAVGLPLFQGKTDFTDLYIGEPRLWTTEATKLAEHDDVLLSVRAPVGPTNLARERCAIGRGLAAVRGRPGVMQRYLLYALRATASTLESQATGTTFAAITSGVIRSHSIRLAPTAEQNRIVAAIEEQFSRLDAGLSALNSARRKLDSFRLSVLREVRNGPWERVPFGDLVENYDGKRVPVKAGLRRAGPYPYYGAQGIIDHVDGFLFDGDFVLVAEDGANLSSRNLPIAFQSHGQFWVNNHAHVVRPKFGMLADYLTAVLNADPLTGAITGTAQPKLPQKALNRLPIPKPPLEEQRRLVAYLARAVTSHDSAYQALTRAVTKAKALRSSILRAAFSGRLVPQDPADESASFLLERMAATRASSNGHKSARGRKQPTAPRRVIA
jgi:type I restriction enzyme, S subunit